MNEKEESSGELSGLSEYSLHSGEQPVEEGKTAESDALELANLALTEEKPIDTVDSRYDHYDKQKLFYAVGKDYFSMKADSSKNFLERMMFDSYKRQKKEETLEKLVKNKQVKISKRAQKKRFKRLYNDSLRRHMARDNMDSVVKQLEKSVKDRVKTNFDFETFYAREINFKREADLKVKEAREMVEREKEDRVKEEIGMVTVKRKPAEEIEKIGERLFEEAKVREMKIEKKKNEIEREKAKNRENVKEDVFYKVLNKKVKKDKVADIVNRLAKTTKSKEIVKKHSKIPLRTLSLSEKKEKKRQIADEATLREVDELFKNME